MSYKRYEIRKASIGKWFDSYIIQTFTDVKLFGHLQKNHLNKSDVFLQKRCKEIKRNTSSFVGDEEEIRKMLISVILTHREELIEYLTDTEDIEVWEVRDSIVLPVTGKKYCVSLEHNWSDGALPCTEMVIALKKNPQNPNLPVITSAYPI